MEHLISRFIAGILVFVLCWTTSPLMAQQTSSENTEKKSSSQQNGPPGAADSVVKPELPDSPGTIKAQPDVPVNESQDSAALPQKQPTGTAAAQRGPVSGSALSKPAGVAIAPAKQRRVRSILIKMGFIAGAGIALGTVAALSMASPPKPPGAP
jgi:hypothetical protein